MLLCLFVTAKNLHMKKCKMHIQGSIEYIKKKLNNLKSVVILRKTLIIFCASAKNKRQIMHYVWIMKATLQLTGRYL